MIGLLGFAMMNVMDDIRLEQIKQLETAMAMWKKRNE
jgi:hypothetical protein